MGHLQCFLPLLYHLLQPISPFLSPMLLQLISTCLFSLTFAATVLLLVVLQCCGCCTKKAKKVTAKAAEVKPKKAKEMHPKKEPQKAKVEKKPVLISRTNISAASKLVPLPKKPSKTPGKGLQETPPKKPDKVPSEEMTKPVEKQNIEEKSERREQKEKEESRKKRPLKLKKGPVEVRKRTPESKKKQNETNVEQRRKKKRATMKTLPADGVDNGFTVETAKSWETQPSVDTLKECSDDPDTLEGKASLVAIDCLDTFRRKWGIKDQEAEDVATTRSYMEE